MEELREVLLPLKLFKSSLWNCVFVLNWLLISLTSLWNCVFVLNWLLISLTSWQGTPLVFQWLRIRLAMWGTQVRSLVRQLRSPIPWSDQAYVPQILKDWGKMVTGPQVSLEMKNRHSGRERGGRKGRGQRLIQAVWKLPSAHSCCCCC